MPTIPAGTKFEAIKPSTVVNRRSALINANDETYTIADFASTIGATITFPLTFEYFPKADNSGSLVNSGLYETIISGDVYLTGDYNGGLNFTSASGSSLIICDNNAAKTLKLADVNGFNGIPFGIDISGNLGLVNIVTNGISVLSFDQIFGDYQIGGTATRFGLQNADTLTASLKATSDLMTNIAGIDYLKINIGGIDYKIQLIP